MQEALAEAIATRTGTDLEQDMYPRILSGAVIAAAQVAVSNQLRHAIGERSIVASANNKSGLSILNQR